MPRPLGNNVRAAKIDASPAGTEKKPSPGGWCSAQRIQNLYDCRWQSYLYYGVTPFGVTDEVEGSNFVPTYGNNRSLRPHQSALAGCQLPLQGKPSLRSTGAVAQSKGSPYTPGGSASPVRRMEFANKTGVRPAPHPSRLTPSHLPRQREARGALSLKITGNRTLNTQNEGVNYV